jgi:nicotinamidase/pyrazinamidase
MKKALILVDLQNDFFHGGSLAVPKAEEIIPLANQLQADFDLIIATQDWHPADHMSFASNHPGYGVGDSLMLEHIPQVLWPVHCVQHSHGAAFHPQLNRDKISKIVYKGTNKHIDSYSAFFDNAHLYSTQLLEYLVSEHMNTVYLLGLASDYCVKYSALDAKHLGLNVFVIQDACRGVGLKPDDIECAWAEMEKAGVGLIQSYEV